MLTGGQFALWLALSEPPACPSSLLLNSVCDIGSRGRNILQISLHLLWGFVANFTVSIVLVEIHKAVCKTGKTTKYE